MEEVTRTFCDVCGTEITHRNQYTVGDYDLCMDTRFDVRSAARKRDVNAHHGLSLRCEVLAKLYIEHPELANIQFLNATDAIKQ